MRPDVAWIHAVDALRRARREPTRQPLLDDAARYRQEAGRCAQLASDAADEAIHAQLETIAETYRRLARQLETLARMS
jgi:hypothetical protein